MKNCSKFCLLVGLLLLSLRVSAQDILSGVVTDISGEPLAGVGVTYRGTNIGDVTDADGKFSIKRIRGRKLNFTFFGMVPQDILVEGQNGLSVVMEEDRLVIEDAVVIGYGSLSKRDLTGSVSSVKAEDLARTGSSSMVNALQGQVAGLSITSQSGEPGSGFNIKIRGNNSINAGTAPLFVIDGMQMDVSSSEVATTSSTGTGTFDPLSFLNPNDIESIEVLKDATATAIYGARGANGVVIITTKSGVTGGDRTIVNLDVNVGISNVPKYIQMLEPQEYVDYRFNRRDYGWTGYGVDLNGDGVKDDAPMDASRFEYYDWQRLLYRTAVTQNYNLSVNAIANQKTQLVASLGYLNQQGLIRNNDYIRYTARLKFDHAIGSKVKVGAGVNYGRNISNGAVSSGGGELGYSGLIQLIYLKRPIEFYTDSDTAENTNGYILTDCVSGETYKKTVYSKIAGNAYLEWRIIPDLLFRAQGSGAASNSKGMEFYTKNTVWGYSKNGYARIKSVDTWNYNASATLSWSKSWKGRHNFDAMLGGELSAYHSENLVNGAYDFLESSTGVFDIGKGGIQEKVTEDYATSTRMSVFGRVNYNYDKRYYIGINFRADGSSKFVSGSRWAWFPSVSLAWRLSEEPFMEQAHWMDQFKIRASAGASGNDRIANYAPLALMSTNYYAIGGMEVMGMAMSSSANSRLKWETTWQYDLGLDLSFLGNRIDLSADVYFKDTRDMLYLATVSAQSGFTQQWQNLGRVTNRGLEVSLVTRNISRPSFQWSTNITFDLSRNEVKDIGGTPYTSINISHGVMSNDISRIMVGCPIGVGYGYVWDGNYQLDDFTATDKWGNAFDTPSEVVTSENYDTFKFTLKEGVTTINSVAVMPGDRRYKDLDGDNDITSADRQVISDSNPDFTLGMGNTFNFKGFELSFFLESVVGRDIMNEFRLRSESGLSGGTQFNNLTKEYWTNHWTPENPSDVYARLLNQTNTWVSSYYVEDGSFLRLKNLSLGYVFDTPRLRKAKIGSIKLSVNADNLFVITKYSGMDPDVSTSNPLFTGFDRLSYPKARTFTFGINMSF